MLSNANGLGGTPSWTQIITTGSTPTTREGHTAVYDAANNRMTIFGGLGPFPHVNNDVWVLSNANGLGGTPAWTQLFPTGSAPTTRYWQTAVYDATNNRMTIFGGYNDGGVSFNDVWVLSNANGLGGTPTWTKITTVGSTPAVRYGHTAVYDNTNNQMTIFGGFNISNYFNDVWVLRNANGRDTTTSTWTKLSSILDPLYGYPATRCSHTAVYDAVNNRMTIFGGDDGSFLNDVWVQDMNNIVLSLLQTGINVPSSVRRGREYTAIVEYENEGNQDIPAPLLNVIGPQNLPLRLSDQDPYSIGTVSLLGIAIDTTPGILHPGQAYSIPIYYYVSNTVPAYTQLQFNLTQTVTDTTPINWSQQSTFTQPTNMDSSAWQAVLSNLSTQMGSTWADYQNALINDANYLYQYYHVYTGGVNTTLALQPVPQNKAIYSINDLYNFEILKAEGQSVQSLLASAVDVSLPGPELGLSFARVAPQMIDRRFHLGALGYGWYHEYEYSLSFNNDSSILVNDAGGRGRQFNRNSNGTYQPLTGDYGNLTTLSDHSFALIELNGLTYHFSTTGVLTSISEPNGNTLTMGYNSGNLVSVTHSNGQAIQMNYNGNNRISQVIDYANRTTNYQYDGSGQYLTQVTGSGGIITQYSNNQLPGTPYDHSLSSITFPDNTHLYFQYDNLGRLSQQYQDGGVGLIQYAYDSQGTITVSDNLGNNTLVRLGPQGQILQIQNPLNQIIQYNYDQNLNLASVIDPANNISLLGSNLQGLTNGILDAAGHIINLSYSSNFNKLSSLQDAKQHLTTFSYDTKGNLLTIVSPDSSSKSFIYDTFGNATSATNRKGQKITYLYNTNGQPTRKNYPDGSFVTYTYDSFNRLTSATDSTGTISMQYDSRDFLTQITYPTGQFFSYSYDSGGKLTQRIDQSSTILNYSYDTAGRLLQLTSGSTTLIQYTYDSAGKVTQETKGNGVYTQYTYDSAGQILSMMNYAPSGSSTLSQFIYTYDSLGNRTSMTTLQGTTRYKYDALSQLTAVFYSTGSVETYTYDSAGNRISVKNNNTLSNYSTNIMNQYSQAGGTTFSYDTDGNMLTMVVSGKTTFYTYDFENRLISVVSLATTWNYTYDALGNRATVTINGVTRHYIYDPISGGALAGEYDNSNTPIAQYTYGLGLIARQDAGTGTQAYYDFDAIGNTRELTGTTGNILNSYDYTPFGILLTQQESISNIFQYVGRFGVIADGNSINFMRNRYYATNIGRFVTEDPINIVGGVNLYTYCVNNPVNLIDPNGLLSGTTKGLILGAVIVTLLAPEVVIGAAVDVAFFALDAAGDAAVYMIKNVAVPTYNNANLFVYMNGDKIPLLFTQIIEDLSYSSRIPKTWIGIGYGIGRFGNYLYDEFKNHPSTPPTTPSPSSLSNTKSGGSCQAVSSVDPNEKIGPAGYGGDSVRYIGVTDPLNYMIYFENESTALAPAQQVIVTDNLVTYLNNSTFALNGISFGSNNIAISQDTQQYFTRVTIPDWRPGTTNQWWVTVTCNFNSGTGQATWTLTIIDPKTGQIPDDALAGFLPPEDGSGRGTGFVSFTVYPKSTDTAGTIINNAGNVIFDTNAAISTNTWFNTIANLPPDAPAFPQPNSSTNNVSLNQLLSWNVADRATQYDVYLWKDGYSQPTSPSVSNLLVTYWTPSTLQSNTQYDWYVVAKNAFGSGTSAQWNFTTVSEPVPVNDWMMYTYNPKDTTSPIKIPYRVSFVGNNAPFTDLQTLLKK